MTDDESENGDTRMLQELLCNGASNSAAVKFCECGQNSTGSAKCYMREV